MQDIRELPVLADACVRGAHFQEALDLAAHAVRWPLVSRGFGQYKMFMQKRTPPSGRYWASCSLLSAHRASSRLSSAPSAFCGGCKFSRSELALAFLTGRVEVLNVATTRAEVEKRGLDTPDVWVRYMKKYIDTWREGVHDLLTQYAAIFLE